MASEYRIHKPYVLATLPRPLDHTRGKILTREVYGQVDGGKKRKRTELVVGVDGETTNIYDVPASRLITSYPIPPQDSFSCAPCSIRLRKQGSTDRWRYTYIVTSDSASQKITLFKDVVHRDGKTTSTMVSRDLPKDQAIYIMSTGASASSVGHILVVSQEGNIHRVSGETLEKEWVSSLQPIVQEALATPIQQFEVEHVAATSISELREGILKHRPETFGTLPKGVGEDDELLLVISRTATGDQQIRHISLIYPSPESSSSILPRLTPLEVVTLPVFYHSESGPVYQLDPQTGSLLVLQNGTLAVYDLTSSIPKLKSTLDTENAQSFIRLSRPFALSCSLDSIHLYNHQYRSIHAKAAMDFSDLPSECREPQSCQLIAYFRSQELVVALADNVLVSFQVESPKRSGHRRKEGLLIDSIRRGASIEISSKRPRHEKQSQEFSKHIPGSVSEDYLLKYQADVEKADRLLSRSDLLNWEEFLKLKFGMRKKDKKVLTNGSHVNGEDGALELPEWEWEVSYTAYPAVDRRWVLYAVSQVFSLDRTDTEEETALSLRLLLPDSNVTTYLVVAGHLTMANLKSAFRDDLDGDTLSDASLANDLINCLVDADASMNLLLNYVESTKLGEVELLLAVRSLMVSMGLILDDKTSQMKLLKNTPAEVENDDMDLDDLEREIALTEHYLGDETSSRSRGLTLALAKLWKLPASNTVKALRHMLKTNEVLSLIYLLRVELVRGAWTSLYMDSTGIDSEGNEPPPDGVISLIADLLGRCIDAIGSGGWLFNDAGASSSPAEANDLLTGLKLEVNAALEGIEEAVFLHGFVSEATRYNSAVQNSGIAARGWAYADARHNRGYDKPMTLSTDGQESRMLPLGLKAKMVVSKEKVVSGGEVVERSSRQTGHLISQKVAPYSLEKLAI